MKRVVFMGTPDFAVPALQALIDTQQVVGVVTQPDRPAGRGQQLRPSPVKVTALAAGIPVIQPPSLRPEAAAAPLRDWRPAAIVVAAYGQILRPHVLDLPPLGCINVHASLLPRWRGAAPIQHAILAGDAQTGVCLMRMEVGLDTGPVYGCLAEPIHEDDTAATLHDRLAALGAALLRQRLDDILAGRLDATPQADDQASYAPMIKKEDGRLDWRQSAAALARRVRAMTPWPGAFTTWQGVPLKIVRATVAERLPAGRPGQVVAYGGGAAVCAGECSLRLQQVQLAGKRALPIELFLRGQPDFVGSTLGDDA